jgi:hypothetical protein
MDPTAADPFTLDIDDTDAEHVCGTHSAPVSKLKVGATCLKREDLWSHSLFATGIKKGESRGVKVCLFAQKEKRRESREKNVTLKL